MHDNILKQAHLALQAGSFFDAEKLFSELLQLNPKHIEAKFFLGEALYRQGNLMDAQKYFKSVTKSDPKNPGGWNALGRIAHERKHLTDAQKFYRKATQLNPLLADAQYHLGILFFEQGRFTEAEERYKKAIAARENYGMAHNNLAFLYQDNGKIELAIKHFKKACESKNCPIDPSSNYLLSLNYSQEIPAKVIFEEHVSWGGNVPTSNNSLKFQAGKNGLRRIGYISSDLSAHPVAYFFEPLLEKHDKNKYEIYCYHTKPTEDSVTKRIMEQATFWRNVSSLSDSNLVSTILNDNLDILVDLSGHTGKNRLLALAHRCAPIQMTWLGYPNTTGLKTIDYRIVDQWTDPEGQVDELMTEKAIRLLGGFLCYRGDNSIRSIKEPPFKKNGYITFGSFNNTTKVNDNVIETWAKILSQVADAIILIKCPLLKSNELRLSIQERFKRNGIPSSRVKLLDAVENFENHMKLYGEVDIALDPFPYNGTTTTCDALWMGTPVLSYSGDHHSARVGESILNQVGKPELIASDIANYVHKAVTLAHNPKRLADLREDLGTSVRDSELCNAVKFVKEVESQYEKVWKIN